KALGGGLLPISLFLTRNDIMNVFTPGTHGSTFGGNPLAAAVGFASLNVLMDEKLIDQAETVGDYFREQLQAIYSPIINEVRVKGLLIGVEVNEPYSAHSICLKLLKQGISTKETHKTVIRFAPPLIINKDQINTAITALKTVFTEVIDNVT